MIPELHGIWKSGGQRWLDELDLADAYAERIGSLRELIAAHGREIVTLDARIHQRFKGHPGCEAIQAIAGVGPVFAAVFVAEIGDVTRFDHPLAVVFVGRVDPAASRVRQSRPSGWDHQAGISTGPLGSRRSDLGVQLRTVPRRRQAQGWGASWSRHRPRRGGPPPVDLGVLRDARRIHPQSRRQRGVRVGHGQRDDTTNGMTHPGAVELHE